MGLRLADAPALTATFTHLNGQELHLDVVGCEVWDLAERDLGPKLLTPRGAVHASAVTSQLASKLDGLWGYTGIHPMRAGNTANGVLSYEADGTITVIWRGGGRVNCGKAVDLSRAAPWHLPG